MKYSVASALYLLLLSAKALAFAPAYRPQKVRMNPGDLIDKMIDFFHF